MVELVAYYVQPAPVVGVIVQDAVKPEFQIIRNAIFLPSPRDLVPDNDKQGISTKHEHGSEFS